MTVTLVIIAGLLLVSALVPGINTPGRGRVVISSLQTPQHTTDTHDVETAASGGGGRGPGVRPGQRGQRGRVGHCGGQHAAGLGPIHTGLGVSYTFLEYKQSSDL